MNSEGMPELTYEQIAYDRFVRARQHSEEMLLPGVEQGHLDGPFDGLDGKARKLIRGAQHFYISTVTGTGWPYVQHRGGPQGFVHVSTDGRRLMWPEFHGNHQFVTTGNVDREAQVCLFFVDYPLRRRLKVFGRARIVEAVDNPELVEEAATVAGKRLRQPFERIMVVDVVATDSNCSKHIQPRWTKAQVDETVDLYRQDIAELKAERAELVSAAAKLRQETVKLRQDAAELEHTAAKLEQENARLRAELATLKENKG